MIMIGSYLKGTEGAGDLDGEIVVAFSTLPNSKLYFRPVIVPWSTSCDCALEHAL